MDSLAYGLRKSLASQLDKARLGVVALRDERAASALQLDPEVAALIHEQADAAIYSLGRLVALVRDPRSGDLDAWPGPPPMDEAAKRRAEKMYLLLRRIEDGTDS